VQSASAGFASKIGSNNAAIFVCNKHPRGTWAVTACQRVAHFFQCGRMNFDPKVFWLFGRSGAGKTTLALRLREELAGRGMLLVYLDGDEVRSTLCSDLGFRSDARLENHRRIAEIARLLTAQGLSVVVSTMAPEHSQRDLVAKILAEKLVWFYIHAPLEVCMRRDPKGIYKRALEGEVRQLIDYPFDNPRANESANRVDTATHNVEECHQKILTAVNLAQLGKNLI
jgi:adenylyl-sulfate kinase